MPRIYIIDPVNEICILSCNLYMDLPESIPPPVPASVGLSDQKLLFFDRGQLWRQYGLHSHLGTVCNLQSGSRESPMAGMARNIRYSKSI